jgi:hypothetical protein
MLLNDFLNEFRLRHQLGHLSPPNHFGDDDVSAWHTVPYGGNPDDYPLTSTILPPGSTPRANLSMRPRDGDFCWPDRLTGEDLRIGGFFERR